MLITVSIRMILCIFLLFIFSFAFYFFHYLLIAVSLNVKFSDLFGVGATGGKLAIDKCTLIDEFSNDFVFGVSTSAYQIEGGWNADGRGLSIWDAALHGKNASLVEDESNADVACDSYHKYLEDVKALKKVGFKSYRFSISWSRILPFGDTSKVNQAGLDYYHRLVDALIEAEIEPVVTLLHYDYPQSLQDIGGPTNSLFSQYFEDYADILFDSFGDKVKKWVTFNEPYELCYTGFSIGYLPPFIESTGTSEYLCAHNILIAHARAYRLYDLKYRSTQEGQVGIALSSRYYYPKTANETQNVERAIQYWLGWFAHPIFSKDGGYPSVMIDEITKNSLLEGRMRPRLNQFNVSMKKFIHGTADFFALNYYTSSRISTDIDANKKSGHRKDLGLIFDSDPNWVSSNFFWLFSVPEGLRKILNWIKVNYNNPEIWILENGWSDDGEISDLERVSYLKLHLKEILKAQNCDGVNVTRYHVWSLMDNFEWRAGYTAKFGLFQVTFNSTNKERTPKTSAFFMKEVIDSKKIPLTEAKTSRLLSL